MHVEVLKSIFAVLSLIGILIGITAETLADPLEPSLQEIDQSAPISVVEVDTSEDQSWLATPWVIEQRDDSHGIVVDGKLTEFVWRELDTHAAFKVVNKDPDNLYDPPNSTQVRFFYSDAGLYVAAELEQSAESFVRLLSAPDGGTLDRDFFTIGLDTSGKGTYGYYFTICLGNTKMEGTLRTPRGFDRNWDGA